MRILAAIAAICLGATPAFAQKISQFPNLNAVGASMTDAVVTESASCTGGNCRTTVAQILAALGTGSSASALTTDSWWLNVQMNGSTTATTIFQDIIGCGACVNADAIRGTLTLTSGSTVTNGDGIAGYVLNQAVSGGTGQNGVAVFGVGVGAVNGAQTWGINVNLTDNTTQAVSSSTGQTLNNEFDFNVTSPNTEINGLAIQGNSIAQPASANGFVIQPLHIGHYDVNWNNSFWSGDGAALTALHVGTYGNPAAANATSQYITFDWTDSGAAEHNTLLYASINGLQTTAAAFAPATANTTNLGSPSLSWAYVYMGVLVAQGQEGATCSGTPSSSFATIGGVVTHC